MLGTMVIPGWVTLVPKYVLIQNLGLINTFGALIVLFYVTPFGIFLMTQLFRSIPRELEEAAIMDGRVVRRRPITHSSDVRTPSAGMSAAELAS
jgi:ABC-type glycerol-3-phosphate transport system permease component